MSGTILGKENRMQVSGKSGFSGVRYWVSARLGRSALTDFGEQELSKTAIFIS
jgi:hypothetical protein